MTASRQYATSRMRRAIGPTHDRSSSPGGGGPLGTRPWLGLRPDSPHMADGMRMEPPPSEPVPTGTMPDAIAELVPPDEPPGERPSCHGFHVAPKTLL